MLLITLQAVRSTVSWYTKDYDSTDPKSQCDNNCIKYWLSYCLYKSFINLPIYFQARSLPWHLLYVNIYLVSTVRFTIYYIYLVSTAIFTMCYIYVDSTVTFTTSYISRVFTVTFTICYIYSVSTVTFTICYIYLVNVLLQVCHFTFMFTCMHRRRSCGCITGGTTDVISVAWQHGRIVRLNDNSSKLTETFQLHKGKHICP